jgi:hypothetical protein
MPPDAINTYRYPQWFPKCFIGAMGCACGGNYLYCRIRPSKPIIGRDSGFFLATWQTLDMQTKVGKRVLYTSSTALPDYESMVDAIKNVVSEAHRSKISLPNDST